MSRSRICGEKNFQVPARKVGFFHGGQMHPSGSKLKKLIIAESCPPAPLLIPLGANLPGFLCAECHLFVFFPEKTFCIDFKTHAKLLSYRSVLRSVYGIWWMPVGAPRKYGPVSGYSYTSGTLLKKVEIGPDLQKTQFFSKNVSLFLTLRSFPALTFDFPPKVSIYFLLVGRWPVIPPYNYSHRGFYWVFDKNSPWKILREMCPRAHCQWRPLAPAAGHTAHTTLHPHRTTSDLGKFFKIHGQDFLDGL